MRLAQAFQPLGAGGALGEDLLLAVLHLTPDEPAGLGAAVRALLAPHRQRDARPGTRPVAAVTRLFPLLDDRTGDDQAGDDQAGDDRVGDDRIGAGRDGDAPADGERSAEDGPR
ncbi:hypothetical protein [Kitasatospora sp. NPDC088548]|uniref:hypothetical protein n=1 Tax=Kitasatospora sp. NPDC088548 TaxID=3364075 RepID=UPI00382F4F64